MSDFEEKKIGVIGAGTMGAGIAQVAAQAGFETLLYDVSREFVDRGLGRIRDFLQKGRERGKVSENDEREILARLRGTLDLEEMRSASLVIEAAPEKFELKREIFQKLDSTCSPDALLATNTSSLSVTAIGGATRKPERTLGLHFFNPPPLMALVEVIQALQTSDATIQRASETVRRFGKTPVMVKDTPGFVVNRIARPYYNEALRILGEGQATIETIDRIMKEAGKFPMGPFELMDLIGNDVNFATTESLYRSLFDEPAFRPSPIQHQLVLAGHLGRKSGKGFYKHERK